MTARTDSMSVPQQQHSPHPGAEPVLVAPGSFTKQAHFYAAVREAELNSTVAHFLELGNERIAQRYCRLHPDADLESVLDILQYSPEYLRWAGCDLMLTVNERSERAWVLIETNTCPSGQKSMPTRRGQDFGGYRTLMENAFVPLLDDPDLPEGELAVLYDKNQMEASGYAAALADLTGESVHLVYIPAGEGEAHARFRHGVLEVSHESGVWVPIRAAVRYVTQRPWDRIPPVTRTLIFNPVLACLAGGRNKALAAKAYARLNATLGGTGLRIRMPDTLWDLTLDEVPAAVARFGGVACVKFPYANAGQGVATIAHPDELAAFMQRGRRENAAGRFVVQALIGGRGWSSTSSLGRLQHVGTMPDDAGRVFVFDLRMMVGARGGAGGGYFPVALYARRAHKPLPEAAPSDTGSWDVLGTNLSVRLPGGEWSTEEDRLIPFDQHALATLGLGLDDLVEAYMQTVLAAVAIDRMAALLVVREFVPRSPAPPPPPATGPESPGASPAHRLAAAGAHHVHWMLPPPPSPSPSPSLLPLPPPPPLPMGSDARPAGRSAQGETGSLPAAVRDRRSTSSSISSSSAGSSAGSDDVESDPDRPTPCPGAPGVPPVPPTLPPPVSPTPGCETPSPPPVVPTQEPSAAAARPSSRTPPHSHSPPSSDDEAIAAAVMADAERWLRRETLSADPHPVRVTRALSEMSLTGVLEHGPHSAPVPVPSAAAAAAAAGAGAGAASAQPVGSVESAGSGRKKFRFGLFASLNPDEELLHQITRE